MLAILLGHVLATLDDQVPVLEHEFRLVLLRLAFLVPLLLLRLGRSATTTFAAPIATPTLPASQPLDRVENLLIEVLHDVEHAQLVLGLGPELAQQVRLQRRSICD